MNITIYYMAQLKRAAGLAQESLAVPDGTLTQVLCKLAENRGGSRGFCWHQGGGCVTTGHEVAAWDVIHETFQRWDANNFEKIVEHGYVNSGDEANYIVYLPMFPLTVWLVKFLIPSFFVSALLVSAVSSVAAGYFLQMLMTTECLTTYRTPMVTAALTTANPGGPALITITTALTKTSSSTCQSAARTAK